jgi:hypothetical protein
MSYLGAVRTMPNYNIMGMAKASLEAAVRYMAVTLGPEGTRVNAISAGPIKTLAASGIGSFSKLLAFNERNAPLRRNVTIEEVGNAAAFLCSDLASGVTGEIMYVDGGFNTTALGNSTRAKARASRSPQAAIRQKGRSRTGGPFSRRWRPRLSARRHREFRALFDVVDVRRHPVSPLAEAHVAGQLGAHHVGPAQRAAQWRKAPSRLIENISLPFGLKATLEIVSA